VIDDASTVPPIEIVNAFDGVTLVGQHPGSRTAGPIQLIQTVIEQTNFDAYMFQDADDLSTTDRLALLLQCAIDTGAELVGSQELRLICDTEELIPVCYPLDVTSASLTYGCNPLLHPTSLVRRDLVMRLGGFATGLRVGGDEEFLRRAVLVAKVVNIPQFCYVRRRREDSLTTSTEIGIRSAARREIINRIKNRTDEQMQDRLLGRSPNLHPLAMGKPVPLVHLAGPPLEPWRPA
jgi:hypothetical protein